MSGGESIVRKVERQETSLRSPSREKGAVCFEVTENEERRRTRVPNDISEPITSKDPDARDYLDDLREYPLPGAGKLGENCGDELPGIFCSSCGEPQKVGRTCRSPDCPRCWQSWAFYQAKAKAAKLEALGRHEYTQNNKRVKQHHLTVSFANLDVSFNSSAPMDRARDAVKALLQRVNVNTGYTIYHSFRIAPEHRGDVMGHESGEGDKTWKDVLAMVESLGWTWEEIREEFLIFAPHFHILGLSETVEKSATPEIEKETGVVIHRIETKRDDGKTKSIANTEELCKAMAYSLSHAGIAPSEEKKTHRAAVRSFGKVTNFEAWGSTDEDDVGSPVYDVDKAMRSVAGTVLGIEFADQNCPASVPSGHDHDAEEDESGSGLVGTGARYLRATSGGGSSEAPSSSVSDVSDSWDATSGMVPPAVNEPSGAETKTCSGKMEPMWKARSYLDSLDWINLIEEKHADGDERLRRLRDACEEWDEMGRSRPETVEPPDE